MPDAFARGRFRGFQFSGKSSSLTGWLGLPRLLSSPGSPSAHPTPALVAHTQGGITLSLEEGEVDADFCQLGIFSLGRSTSVRFWSTTLIAGTMAAIWGPFDAVFDTSCTA